VRRSAAKIFESRHLYSADDSYELAGIQAAAQDLNKRQEFVVDVDIDNMDDYDNSMGSMEGFYIPTSLTLTAT
jgi:hypothetical protein